MGAEQAVQKASRWEASDTVAINTNWFVNNLQPARRGMSAKFTVQMLVPTSTVVEFDITDGTVNKTGTVNDGVALVADTWQQFDVIIPAGYSFNIQHATTTQNVACHVFESSGNADI